MCIRRHGQGELLSFDLEPKRTANRLRREQRETQVRNLAVMPNQEEQDQGHERNEPQGGQNGNNGRNNAYRPFIQLDDPYMLLEEFALPPTVVQSTIRRRCTSEQLRVENSNTAGCFRTSSSTGCQVRIQTHI